MYLSYVFALSGGYLSLIWSFLNLRLSDLAVWLVNTLLSLDSKDGSIRSLNPRLNDQLNTKEHPDRIPLAFLIGSLASVPLIVLVVVPCLVFVFKQWLQQPHPRRPEGRLLRILYFIFVK